MPFMMDRLDRSYHDGHVQLDVERQSARRTEARARKPATISRRSCAKGRIFRRLRLRRRRFEYRRRQRRAPVISCSAATFPMKSSTPAKCRHEIDELLDRDDLTQEDKEAVLGGNALQFYRPAL